MNHDELYSIIDNQILHRGYDVFTEIFNIVIVAIDEELRFERCLNKIKENNSESNFLIIAHERMYNYIVNRNIDNIDVFKWSGRYDSRLAELVLNNCSWNKIDAFLYFSEQEMNRRDTNLIHVAELLDDINPIKTFCNSIGDELYEIKDVHILNQAYKVYTEINNLLYMQEK